MFLKAIGEVQRHSFEAGILRAFDDKLTVTGQPMGVASELV